MSASHNARRRRPASVSRRGRVVAKPLGRRLGFEPLEDRRLLAVLTVTSSADNLVVDGMVTLREAIQAANTDASVDGSTAGSGADTIAFDGALSGQTITLGGTELEITEALTIDATALASHLTIDANSASRIFNITAATGDFTLAGLTLIGGQTTGDNVNSSDTTFSGGGVRSQTADTLTMDQSTVSGNSTTGTRAEGGGIFSLGAVVLTQSTVSGNSTAGSSAQGGGIRSISNSGTVTLTDSSVNGNSTLDNFSRGGGIFADGAVALTQSTASGNSTAGSSADGGGIFSFGNVTLTQSTVSGNHTVGGNSDGGGIFSFATLGNVTLNQSTVSGNSTAGVIADGGGIYARGLVTLNHSTVSGNSTAGDNAHGGGISAIRTITLNHSTVTDNHATFANATGGGVSNDVNPINITNSIVAGNTASGGMDDINPGVGTLNVNFSLIEQVGLTITGGNNSIGLSANLAALANNGGLTETHALLVGSPAIDTGDPSLLFSPTEFDQRGAPFARVSGGRIDMGAFEWLAPVSSADFDQDGDVDGADFLTWQRGFGTPGAQPSDGDADNDMDVDSDDLAVWQGQYGTVPPLAALESAEPVLQPAFGLREEILAPEQDSQDSQLSLMRSQPLLESALIGAALESMHQPAAQDDLLIEVPAMQRAAERDTAFAWKAMPTASAVTRDNSASPTGSEEEDRGEHWLTQELLEAVFGEGGGARR